MNLIRLAAECSCSAQRVAAFRAKLSPARSSNRFDLVVTVPRPRADGRSANPKPSHAAFYPWQVWDKKYGPWFRVQHGIGPAVRSTSSVSSDSYRKRRAAMVGCRAISPRFRLALARE
jgi:hypothetical protein